ncbi:MAG: 2-oxoacid:acceptor oxidoreductase family protein [Burkholderiales bacterium]|nr:2-oxoacid:acceptor oxidoreductase family protein [Burkholderiales bacterium]
MLQIVIQGRGGQGAQTAGHLLAAAFFAAGREVQCFASYGGARRGTPVSASLRVDERPIRLRCDIERADALLCFDASLLAGPLLACTDQRTLIVVNSAHDAAHFALALPGRRVLPVDALALTRRHGLGRIVNSALLGAFGCALGALGVGSAAGAAGAPSLEVLEAVLGEGSPKLRDENLAACRDGWHLARTLQPSQALSPLSS